MCKSQFYNTYNVKIRIDRAENVYPARIGLCVSLLFNFNAWSLRILDSDALLRPCHTAVANASRETHKLSHSMHFEIHFLNTWLVTDSYRASCLVNVRANFLLSPSSPPWSPQACVGGISKDIKGAIVRAGVNHSSAGQYTGTDRNQQRCSNLLRKNKLSRRNYDKRVSRLLFYFSI